MSGAAPASSSRRNLKWLVVIGVIVVAGGALGFSLLRRGRAYTEPQKAFDGDSTGLKRTVIVPTLDTPAGEEAAGGKRASGPAASDAIREELEAIAACFQQGVSALQDEPGERESLAAFLARAERKLKASGNDVPKRFSRLRRDKLGEKLLLSSGDEVLFEISEEAHNLYVGFYCESQSRYRFYCEGRPEFSETIITMGFGKPPEDLC